MSGAVYQPLPLARASAKMKRQPLLSSCAVAAAMVAVGYAGPVRAQAFQAGTPTAVLGSATRNITSGTTERIVIDTPTAVLNWTPTDSATGGGAIDYLPAGNVATFTNGSGITDYTVLNRIIPADSSRPVAFNGSVFGTIGVDPAVPGGNIWFYSPGGIIAGATATFDVGSLILTANDIDFSDGFLFGPSNQIRFRGDPDSRSSVTIQPGAQITASPNNSYVALVAPRVSQGGTVNVNGSAAYVAAESADITINGGLFDIAIQTGSAVNTGGETTLAHTGTTTGPGPNDSESQAIYLVAVPKNDAVTMLVSGSLGYGAATGAALENGTVILSAGYGVTGLAAGPGQVTASLSAPVDTHAASITISGGDFTSRVNGYATTDITASGGGGTLHFASALDLWAGRNSSLVANAGEAIAVDGSLRVKTTNITPAGVITPGQAAIRALGGGTITVLGGATAEATNSDGAAGNASFEATGAGSLLDFRRESFVYANGIGFTAGASATGGTAAINITGGSLRVGEQVQVTADGTGAGGTSGGNGTGGTASINAVNGIIEIAGPLLVSASGTGARGLIGGNGTGGNASVSLDDSALSAGTPGNLTSLRIAATGSGGPGTDGGAGGSGQGGIASLSIFDSTPDASPSAIGIDSISIDTRGSGGGIETGYGLTTGGSGGAGTGGTSSLTLSAGILTSPSISIDARGDGASGNSAYSGPNAGNGGAGTGGSATLTVNGGSLVGSGVSVVANGDAGSGGSAFEVGYGASGAGGAGGVGMGGTASFVQNGGGITGGFFDVGASGSGGNGGFSSSVAGGAGGVGTGGDATATLGGGTLTLTSSFSSTANGSGGEGGESNTLPLGGLGGNGQGGTASFIVQGGAVDIPNLFVGSTGSGDSGGYGVGFNQQAAGGASRGGTAELELLSGSLVVSSLEVRAVGDGAYAPGSAASGEARGGIASATISGGTLSATSNIIVNASASLDGGEGGNPADVFGGTASFLVDNGASFNYSGVDSLSVNADAFAGTSFFNGVGGNATGGTASFTVNDASATLAASSPSSGYTLNLSADGVGGQGFDGGAAGNGTGGTAELVANGGTINITGAVRLSAAGQGGGSSDAGDGGFGQGGTISVFSGGGSDQLDPIGRGSITFDTADLDASGSGGDANESGYGFSTGGGDGGAGIGGTATFEARNGSITVTSSADLLAYGEGGSASNGGNGGNGTGGTVSVISGGDSNGLGLIDIPNLFIDVSGAGESTFESGYGSLAAGGNGGIGTGGIVNIFTDAGDLSVNSLNISASGEGGQGGGLFSGTGTGPAGNGGAGFGGTVSVLAKAGDMSVSSLSVSAGGEGGQGGSYYSGTTSLAAGNGGAATGGSITLGTQGGGLSLNDVSLFAQADGGFGGFGSNGATGGSGGSATGGSVTITAGDSPLDISGTSTFINVSAYGGRGGSTEAGSGPAGNAGNGGNATGGSLTLSASGEDGALTLEAFDFDGFSNAQLQNDARGGDGGDGGNGTLGGNGGNGGNATGGTVEIATDLGSVMIDGAEGGPDISVTAIAGDGGEGGAGSTVGNTGGVGGNGGEGTGGVVRVRVNGGAVDLGSPNLFAHGNGGFAGNGGQGTPTPAVPGNPSAIPPIDPIPEGPTPFASSGFDGSGRGGTVSIIVSDNIDTGETGSATFGDTQINVAGFYNDEFSDIGGRIEIYDNGSAPDGGIEIASLNAVSTGYSNTSDQAIDIYSAERRINILGNANIDGGGFTYFRASNTGGLDVGGSLNINSGLFVFVQHDSQPETPVDTITANGITSTSLFDFNADPDSRIYSTNGIDITSFASGIAVNYARADSDINLNAPGNITGAFSAGGSLSAASTGGRVDFDDVFTGQDLTIRAATTAGLGTANVGGFLDLESNGNVTRLDDVTAFGDIEIDAGYDLTQPDDSNVVLNPNATVTAGNITSTDGEIDIEATGSTTGGTFSAGHELSITSLTGSVTLDSATAGTLNVPVSTGNSRSIGIAAALDVNIGSGTAAADIGLAALTGTVTAGSLNAGGNIVLLAGDQVALDSASASGLFYVANSSMLSALGTDPSNFNAANLFGVTPTATGGNVTISGTVDAGPVVIASGGVIDFADINSSSFVRLGAASNVSGNSIYAASDIDIFSGGAVDIDIASTFVETGYGSFGGSITVDAADDVALGTAIAQRNITVTSGGAVEIGSATAVGEFGYGGLVGSILVDAKSIAIDAADAASDIVLTTADGNAFLANPISGNVITAGTLTAGRDINVDGLDTVSVSSASAGRDLGIISATLLEVGTVDASRDIKIDGAYGVTAGTVTGGRDVEIATSLRANDTSTTPSRSIVLDSAEAGDDLIVGAFGTVTAGSLTTTGAGEDGTAGVRAFYPEEPGSTVYLISEKGSDIGSIVAADNVRAINVPEFRNGFQISDGSGGISIDSITAGGNVDLFSPNSAILVSNDLNAAGLVNAFSTAVTLNALGNLNLAEARATAGGITLNIGGDLIVSDVVSGLTSVAVESGGDVTVTGTGQIRSDGTIGVQADGNMLVQAGGSIGLGAVSSSSGGNTQVRLGGPADQVSLAVGQTLSIDGTVVGLSIDLGSSDIAVGSGALIGDTDTGSLSIANTGTGRTFIGGAGTSGSYSLANAEFGRLQAANIFVFGPRVGNNSGLADVTIQGLDISGSQTGTPPSGRRANLVGSDASLFINTNGSARVEGNVALASAGQSDTLTISANQRIDLVVPNASISIKDAQGALAGRLRLFANTVQATTTQAATDIASLTDTDAIDDRLGRNDGTLRPEGYLQANALEFGIENALYIQNSGGPGLGSVGRAGFTAGSGGVSINTGESSNARIIINGRQSDGTTFIGGADLIPLISFNGEHNPTGGFDLRSTANGCLIIGRSCRFDMEVVLPPVPPVQDVIAEVIDAPDNSENQDGTAVVQALNLPLIQLVDYDGLSFEPLIDEPVTGTGNDDLWLGDDEKDDGDGK